MAILGNKGKKTTVIGIILLIVIIGVFILKYMGKLGEGVSDVLISLSGLLTAVGFLLTKDFDKSHTQNNEEEE